MSLYVLLQHHIIYSTSFVVWFKHEYTLMHAEESTSYICSIVLFVSFVICVVFVDVKSAGDEREREREEICQ